MPEDLDVLGEAELGYRPGDVRCVPLPSWVELDSYSRQAPEPMDAYIGNGVCRLLHETQVNLTDAGHARHFRTAERVLTRAGAEQVAHFMVELDPTYERLDVHFIRVWRDTECLDHAKQDSFQIFRRETSIERLVLNGRVTVSLLIPDIRVGDIIETGFTLYGGPPILGGKYASWIGFDSFTPHFEMRHRLLRPMGRNIVIKNFNDPPACSVIEKNAIEESRWQVVGMKRREATEFTPPWLILVPALQFSEFRSWNEIACLFAPLYESPDIPEPLAEEIDRIAGKYADPAERAAEWLGFVQQKLRYFALSLGEGGLVPRGLETIWKSRFGDCKDAAKLYVAGARRMGLDACAALVSTSHGPALDGFLPSASLFNHCIARLRLNGATYWLDPTMQAQSGHLDRLSHPHAGWALPLTSATGQLERLGGDIPLHYLSLEDELRLGPKRESSAEFRRHIDHFFWAADSVRNRLANEGPTVYANERFKELQPIWPGILETRPMEIHDDRSQNCLTTIFTYEIPHCWKPTERDGQVSFKFTDTDLVRELGLLNVTQRQDDIYLGRPRKVTRYLRITMPCKWSGAGWSDDQQTTGLSYVDRLTMDGNTIGHLKELSVGNWSIPASAASSYNEIVLKLRQNDLYVRARERRGKIRPIERSGWSGPSSGLVTAIVVFWFIAMVLSAITRHH